MLIASIINISMYYYHLHFMDQKTASESWNNPPNISVLVVFKPVPPFLKCSTEHDSCKRVIILLMIMAPTLQRWSRSHRVWSRHVLRVTSTVTWLPILATLHSLDSRFRGPGAPTAAWERVPGNDWIPRAAQAQAENDLHSDWGILLPGRVVVLSRNERTGTRKAILPRASQTYALMY